ncbi:MAG: chromate transporter [Clostridiales bacterium]|nr:chromate transporter [Candidatus Scatonaster coprocaballi]
MFEEDGVKSLTAKLFVQFFKIGAFTFGGGYAMIPLIQSEVVDKNKWMEAQELLDVVAIAESTPGPIAINAATYVGYKVSGLKGAIAATLGVTIPSFTIITLIAMLFTNFSDNRYVQNAFWGIRIAVLALILKAVISMYKKCPKSIISYLIMAMCFVVVTIFHINVLWAILASAVIGLVSQGIGRKKQGGEAQS